jgi:hypothetical protein
LVTPVEPIPHRIEVSGFDKDLPGFILGKILFPCVFMNKSPPVVVVIILATACNGEPKENEP